MVYLFDAECRNMWKAVAGHEMDVRLQLGSDSLGAVEEEVGSE